MRFAVSTLSHWVSAEFGALHICEDTPEARHSLPPPELNGGLIYSFAAVFVLPVQVRLALKETVQEVLLTGLAPSPGAAMNEAGTPICRLFEHTRAVVLPISPNVPVCLRVVSAARAFHEPRMLVGRVIDDQVEDDAHTAAFHFRDQFVHVFHRSEIRVNGLVIRDVVAEVLLRALIDGTQPNDIDTECLQVAKLLDDTPDIAMAFGVGRVGVFERSRPNLVEDLVLPPRPAGGSIRLS